jgi:hypothetical protein
VIPYVIHDAEPNQAWVSVGIDHDTSECAMAPVLDGCLLTRVSA